MWVEWGRAKKNNVEIETHKNLPTSLLAVC